VFFPKPDALSFFRRAQWKLEDITPLYGVTVSARVVLWVREPVVVTVML
jgi:hypothetical protein